jgi:hypothetical protein
MIRTLNYNYCQYCQYDQDCKYEQTCQECFYHEISSTPKKMRVDSENVFFESTLSVISQEEISKDYSSANLQTEKSDGKTSCQPVKLHSSSTTKDHKSFDKILQGKLIKKPYYLHNHRPNDWTRFPANPSGNHIVDLYFDNNFTFSKLSTNFTKTCDESKITKKYEFGYWYMFNNPNLEIFRCNWESMISKNDTRDWFRLSSCPGAVHLLQKNVDKVHIVELCRNPSSEAIKLLKTIESDNHFHDYSDYSDHEKFEFLFENPCAGPMLRENLSKINWLSISRNKSQEAMNIVQEYFFMLMLENEHVTEESLSNLSENEFAISFLEQNPEYIDWKRLSKNPRAIDLLKENPEKIDWLNLAFNPGAIDLLEQNIDKFIIKNTVAVSESDTDLYLEHQFIKRFWINLCFNPRATRILAKHLDCVDIEGISPFIEDLGHLLCSVVVENFQDFFKDWTHILTNPNIVHVLFPLDLEKIYLNSFYLHQELIAKVMCPKRISNLSKTYGISFAYYLELYNI